MFLEKIPTIRGAVRKCSFDAEQVKIFGCAVCEELFIIYNEAIIFHGGPPDWNDMRAIICFQTYSITVYWIDGNLMYFKFKEHMF